MLAFHPVPPSSTAAVMFSVEGVPVLAVGEVDGELHLLVEISA